MAPPEPRRRWLLLSLALGLCGVACHPTQSGWPPALFPSPAGTTVLPLRDPLLARDLSVEAQARVDDGREVAFWMLVDSGASEVALPSHVAGALGLRQIARTRAAVVGPAKTTALTVVVVPELGLGALAVRRLLVGVLPLAVGILGQSVLRHAPWELSWDRGTLTLGAPAWTEQPGITSAALHRADRYPLDEVQVRIDGRPVNMVFDTGAVVSAIPEDMAVALGLASEPFRGPLLFGAGGPFQVSRLFRGGLEIGGTRIERQAFLGLPGGREAHLGLDVLSQFDLFVVPGQRVLLRPRVDPRSSAAARIRRWAWIPASCRSSGCVRARIDPEGHEARVQLQVEAELPRSAELILGCAEPPPALVTQPVAAGLTTENHRPLPHVVVRMTAIKPGLATVAVPFVAETWFSAGGLGCNQLEVLDVVPVPSASADLPFLQARFVP